MVVYALARRKKEFEVHGVLVSKASVGITADDRSAKVKFRVQNDAPPRPVFSFSVLGMIFKKEC